MRIKPFKDVVLASGMYILRERGEKIPGLDLTHYIERVMAAAGYPNMCSCNPICEPDCKISVINDLKAEIDALKVRLVALEG